MEHTALMQSSAHHVFTRIAEQAGTAILRCTVPVYRDEDNEIGLEFDRTGVLFRIGSEHFLLTASHEVERFLSENRMLWADVSKQTDVPIPLVDSKFYGTEVSDQFPDRDIVAIHLDANAVGQFYPQRRFLTLANCDQCIDQRPALYMVAGYPWDSYQMTSVVYGPAMFFFGNIEPNPTTDNFDVRIHVALSVDAYGLRATDTGFVRAEIPPFNGMSGCGIWRVAPSTMRDPDLWNPSMVRLVAIQNRTREGSHTIGTWLTYVVDRIVDELPDLKPAIEIEYKPGY